MPWYVGFWLLKIGVVILGGGVMEPKISSCNFYCRSIFPHTVINKKYSGS